MSRYSKQQMYDSISGSPLKGRLKGLGVAKNLLKIRKIYNQESEFVRQEILEEEYFGPVDIRNVYRIELEHNIREYPILIGRIKYQIYDAASPNILLDVERNIPFEEYPNALTYPSYIRVETNSRTKTILNIGIELGLVYRIVSPPIIKLYLLTE